MDWRTESQSFYDGCVHVNTKRLTFFFFFFFYHRVWRQYLMVSSIPFHTKPSTLPSNMSRGNFWVVQGLDIGMLLDMVYSLESTCRFLSLCVHVYTQIDNASFVDKDLCVMLETLGHLEKKFIEMVLDNKPSWHQTLCFPPIDQVQNHWGRVPDIIVRYHNKITIWSTFNLSFLHVYTWTRLVTMV